MQQRCNRRYDVVGFMPREGLPPIDVNRHTTFEPPADLLVDPCRRAESLAIQAFGSYMRQGQCRIGRRTNGGHSPIGANTYCQESS